MGNPYETMLAVLVAMPIPELHKLELTALEIIAESVRIDGCRILGRWRPASRRTRRFEAWYRIIYQIICDRMSIDATGKSVYGIVKAAEFGGNGGYET